MNIGYARISTPKQSLEPQIQELKRYGCTKVYSDTISSTKAKKEGLIELFDFAREQDIIVVVRLDRLARSLKDLITTVNLIEQKKIKLISLHENIDTTTPSGMLTFHIFASLAEFERSLIVERTKAGLEAARVRGRLGGRPKLLNQEQIKLLKLSHKNKDIPISTLLKQFNISKATFYKYLKTV